jgi:hypothetical protein
LPFSISVPSVAPCLSAEGAFLLVIGQTRKRNVT